VKPHRRQALADGQDVVLNTLQGKQFDSGVNIVTRWAFCWRCRTPYPPTRRNVVHQADVRHADPGHVSGFMSIDGVVARTSYIGTSILISGPPKLNDLTTQLATGKVSTTYAGQGIDRGFALGLRAQVSIIDSYSNTSTNVNTRLSVVNLALQGMSDVSKQTKSAATFVDHHPQQQPVRTSVRSRRRRRSPTPWRC